MTTVDQRLRYVERKVFGDKLESYFNPDLKNRLFVLNQKLDEIESKLGDDYRYCTVHAKKYSTFLSEKRTTMQNMVERFEYITATRYEIEKNLHMLSIIKDTAAVVDVDLFQEILQSDSTLMDRVFALEQTLGNQLIEVNKQTNEMDALLDSYDELMTILSEKTAGWDFELKAAEKQTKK